MQNQRNQEEGEKTILKQNRMTEHEEEISSEWQIVRRSLNPEELITEKMQVDDYTPSAAGREGKKADRLRETNVTRARTHPRKWTDEIQEYT